MHVEHMQPFWKERSVHLQIDPDKWQIDDLRTVLTNIPHIVKTLIVGGTFIHSDNFAAVMEVCLATNLPVANVVSVGSADTQISPKASHVLVPVMLAASTSQFVTQHVIRSVPLIAKYRLATVPYAYVVLAGGISTSVEFFTQTFSVPREKPEILATLARAAKCLGLGGVYLEAGSGAIMPVTPSEVFAVRNACSLPIAVGGGVSSAITCNQLFAAGATSIVVGTALERHKSLSWLCEV